MRQRRPASLTRRLLTGLILWTVLSLGLSAIVLSSIYRTNARQAFDDLLVAQAFNIMGALSRSPNGVLRGAPTLGDPRFARPMSGWVWRVAEADRPHAASQSLADGALEAANGSGPPAFDDTFRRFYDGTTSGTPVRVHDAQLFVDDGDRLVTVSVAGPLDVLDEQIRFFDRVLFGFLLVFGIGLVVATVLIVRQGLQPLDAVREDLSDVREGRRDALSEKRPREVAPLVEEINALVQANRAIVERARSQVGNLAHALKTPLAVLRNDAKDDATIEQLDSMRRQIDTYLGRARIAAVRDSAAARTNVQETLEPIARVVGRLNPSIDIDFDAGDEPVVFAGERQDLEEIAGNLTENAARHAASRVLVRIDASSGRFRLVVADDGPGIPDEERETATARGVRLDERRKAHGSGLGLSIVRDLVDAYEGEFVLETSPWGGLEARVTLPCPRLVDGADARP